jgi:hypothetical protein
MSHAAEWRCRSCRTILGQVLEGVLRPSVPVESVNGQGIARVPCPQCGRVRAWVPSPTRPSPQTHVCSAPSRNCQGRR